MHEFFNNSLLQGGGKGQLTIERWKLHYKKYTKEGGWVERLFYYKKLYFVELRKKNTKKNLNNKFNLGFIKLLMHHDNKVFFRNCIIYWCITIELAPIAKTRAPIFLNTVKLYILTSKHVLHTAFAGQDLLLAFSRRLILFLPHLYIFKEFRNSWRYKLDETDY